MYNFFIFIKKFSVLSLILFCTTLNLGCSSGTSQSSTAEDSGAAPGGGGGGGTPAISCPANYVKVLANTTYGTNTFCVSKYEMKVSQNDGTAVFNGYNGGVALDVTQYKPESRANGIPWVRILYSDMLAECTSLGAGYRLITAMEWQVVARDVETVGANWSGGVSGSGTLYTGHSDSAISGTAISDGHAVAGTQMLSAGDGSDPYVGTGQNSTLDWAAGKEQKRSLMLSSGDEIWDLVGNARELVDIDGLGSTLSYTGPASANFYEVNSSTFSTMLGTAISSNSVSISSSWFLPTNALFDHATNKIGRVYINNGAQSPRVVTRGSNFSSGNSPGLYAADFDQNSANTSSSGSFRCVAPTN